MSQTVLRDLRLAAGGMGWTVKHAMIQTLMASTEGLAADPTLMV